MREGRGHRTYRGAPPTACAYLDYTFATCNATRRHAHVSRSGKRYRRQASPRTAACTAQLTCRISRKEGVLRQRSSGGAGGEG